jgi:hypothetical protein
MTRLKIEKWRKIIMKSLIAVCFLALGICIYLLSIESRDIASQINHPTITPTPANVMSNVGNDNLPIPSKTKVNAEHLQQLITEYQRQDKKRQKEDVLSDIYIIERNFLQKAKINSLKKSWFSTEEKEVRVLILDWNLDFAIREPEMYIFRFKQKIWEARSIKLNAERKIVRRNLEPPTSGWSDWEIFLDDKMSPSSLRNLDNKIEKSAIISVIESKFGDDYTKKIVFQPERSRDGLFLEFFHKLKKDFNIFQSPPN